MFASDRVRIIADAPLTLVAAWLASQTEREAAYPLADARFLLARLYQVDRGKLVEMYGLLCNHQRLPVQLLSTSFITERLSTAVLSGELLLVPGWYGLSGYANADDLNETSTSEGRVARRIMGQKLYLTLEGSNYRVVTLAAWGKTSETASHQLVSFDEAVPILTRLAARAASGDQRVALQEAVSLLSRTHPSVLPAVTALDKGLVLARQTLPSPATPLEAHTGSAADAPGSVPVKKPTPKKPAVSCPSDFVLSPCRIVNVKDSMPIAATEQPGFSAGTYEWKTSSTKITLENANSSTVSVKALDTVSGGRDAEIITVTRTQEGCPPVVQEAKVTVAKVTFSVAATQCFGYDDFDTAGDPTDDHVCIKKSDHTFLRVKIAGGAVGTDFNFVCDAATVCTAVAPEAAAEFDLRLDAAAENKKETVLHAKVKCPAATSFAHIKVHVYKQRDVDVVVAKIDKTTAGTNLLFPTADYAAHAPAANAKLKEAVVKYNITNFSATNAATPVNLAGGAATLTFDIAAGGGADVTAIGTAMTGTGTKIRVAIIRDMKSVYFLKTAAAVGDTTLTVTAASTFFKVGNTPPLGTGATRENISITALAGNTITCAALTQAHAVGETIEFPAAGWSTDPILIIEGRATLDVAKWTILHEVGHRALALADVIDTTNFMHFSQAWTDYRLRYCPRKKIYPAGTTATENQWETIPRT